MFSLWEVGGGNGAGILRKRHVSVTRRGGHQHMAVE
jgi:hypothetical protein